MTPTQVSGAADTADVSFGGGALEDARMIGAALDFFLLVDAVCELRLTGALMPGVFLLFSAIMSGVVSCPSKLFFVTPAVSATNGSIWFRKTSESVPTLRARSIFSACCGVTSSVTAFTTRGLVSSRPTSYATASTNMRSRTILEIDLSRAVASFESRCVLTMMST